MTTNCLFTELANIIVVIVPNPMFVLPWVHEKFTVKFTLSNVDGCAIYIYAYRLPLTVLSGYTEFCSVVLK